MPWLMSNPNEARSVETLIQVAERSPSEQREPAPSLMLCAVVQHVATLAQRLEVRGPVVGRVVIEVRASQDHTRGLNGTVQSQRGSNCAGPLPCPSRHCLVSRS